MDYSTEILSLVNNPHYTFYKLSINGVFQFDEFVKDVETISTERKSLESILRLMDEFGPQLLPKSKFHKIPPNNKKKERDDIFEFKKDTLRVYVILQKPYVYVVRGGRKKDQKQDIAKVKRDTKMFNP